MTTRATGPRPRARELVGVALLVIVGVVLLATPAIPSFCPMRVVLGVPCPTCGMTRATRLALGGHFAEATHLHPLWFAILPLLAITFVVEVVGYARTGRWGAMVERPAFRRVGAVLLAAILVVWLARFAGAFGGPAPI